MTAFPTRRLTVGEANGFGISKKSAPVACRLQREHVAYLRHQVSAADVWPVVRIGEDIPFMQR